MNEEEMNRKVGFRFRPNDEELINHYLKKMIQGLHSQVSQAIAFITNFLKIEPWDLPAFSKEKSKDPFWYFIYQLDYKYLNSKRANRKTEAGFWKVTGKDRKVRSRDTQQIIGIKKTLVFYRGCVSKNSRTNWVMHEYHITSEPNPKAYVICRLEKKADGKASTSTPDEVESSHQSNCQSPSDFGNHVAFTHDEVESSRQSPSYFGNHVAEDPLSQADLGAVTDCDELDYNLFSEAQLFEQDQDLPSDCNRIQTQLDITEPPLSNNFSSHCNGGQTQFGTIEPLLSNSCSSDCNEVQTQHGTTEPEEDSAPWDSYLVDECEAYPEETVSHKKLVVESEGLNLNRGVIDMSLPRLLESSRGMPYIEDCHEVAIAQPREAMEHVIATDLPTTKNSDANMTIKSSWNGQVDNNHKSFFIFPNSPQLSHSSPQLSHNSPQLSRQQRIPMHI